MEIAAVTNTEPAPQQFTARHGKTRSWERGIVYDPAKESLKIRKIKKIERDSSASHISCALPPSSSIVYVYSKNPEDIQVVTSEGKGKEEQGIVFLGRLNLEKLGLRDQFSRFCGQLKTLYIVTSSPSKSENSVTGERATPGVYG